MIHLSGKSRHHQHICTNIIMPRLPANYEILDDLFQLNNFIDTYRNIRVHTYKHRRHSLNFTVFQSNFKTLFSCDVATCNREKGHCTQVHTTTTHTHPHTHINVTTSFWFLVLFITSTEIKHTIAHKQIGAKR